MGTTTLIVILAVIVALWLLREYAHQPEGFGPIWPVVSRSPLTPREQLLYHRLVLLFPGHIVLAQVALSQFIDVKPNVPNSRSLRGKYKQLVADFVLCRSDFSIVAVIELDDSTHAQPHRQDADARKRTSVQSAGLHFVRVPAGSLPVDMDLRRAIVGNPANVHNVSADASLAPVERGSRTKSFETLRPAIAIVLVVLALGAIWSAYRQFIEFPKAIAPMMGRSASGLSHSTASLSNTTPPVPMLSSAASVTTTPPPLSPEKERVDSAEQLARRAAIRMKEKAWLAAYSAPAFCEHPPTWKDQVECGNQYMRAKREFDTRWANEHSGIPPATKVSSP